MAKTQKTPPKGRASNPLGGVTKKPASYVGDLDDLLGQVTDEPETEPQAPQPKRRGGAASTSKATKKEMKIDTEEEPRSRINLLLPSSLHRQFKVKAATEGVTMTSVLESFIRDYVGE